MKYTSLLITSLLLCSASASFYQPFNNTGSGADPSTVDVSSATVNGSVFTTNLSTAGNNFTLIDNFTGTVVITTTGTGIVGGQNAPSGSATRAGAANDPNITQTHTFNVTGGNAALEIVSSAANGANPTRNVTNFRIRTLDNSVSSVSIETAFSAPVISRTVNTATPDVPLGFAFGSSVNSIANAGFYLQAESNPVALFESPQNLSGTTLQDIIAGGGAVNFSTGTTAANRHNLSASDFIINGGTVELNNVNITGATSNNFLHINSLNPGGNDSQGNPFSATSLTASPFEITGAEFIDGDISEFERVSSTGGFVTFTSASGTFATGALFLSSTDGAVTIPEPTSTLLLSLGLGGLLLRKSRKA